MKPTVRALLDQRSHRAAALRVEGHALLSAVQRRTVLLLHRVGLFCAGVPLVPKLLQGCDSMWEDWTIHTAFIF